MHGMTYVQFTIRCVHLALSLQICEAIISIVLSQQLGIKTNHTEIGQQPIHYPNYHVSW